MGAHYSGREYQAELIPYEWFAMTTMPSIPLPGGETMPTLGQGTWQMAEDRARRADEIKALRTGVDLGMTLIDTAEMYGNGASEELIGEALADRRNEIFLVSKVLPENATRRGTVKACERSLKRLRTDRLDLYLLHWRGSVPLSQTIEAFEDLMQAGHIRRWGVSNFDTDDMEELVALPGGNEVSTDQELYNLTRRGIEYDLMPWARKFALPLMAYSPIEQGELLRHPALRKIAQRLSATPSQVALAWVLTHSGVCAIPKAGRSEHVVENYGALNIHLTPQDMAALDATFPPPKRKIPLEMI
jgi:diketogulonate reductase-like aldo/keto reductase